MVFQRVVGPTPGPPTPKGRQPWFVPSFWHNPCNTTNVTPTSYQYNHGNRFSRDPEISILGGSGWPRGPQRPLPKAGRFAPRLLEWFLGPPGPSRRPKIDDLWVRKVSFHDYIDTKLGLLYSVNSFHRSGRGPKDDLSHVSLEPTATCGCGYNSYQLYLRPK